MLAVVKKPHTRKPTLKIEGSIPSWMIVRLKKEYGDDLAISDTEKIEDYIDVTESTWYKRIKKTTSAGDSIKIYRENLKLTQVELGKRLGNIPRQNISAMEKGKRGISKEIAKKLSRIFKVPIDRFID